MASLAKYRIPLNKSFDLDDMDPASKPFSLGNKVDDLAYLATLSDKIRALQELLYANHTRSLLVVLQGTDTSGKDGTVRSVFSHVNPQGISVAGFKAPTADEQDHDFLWRIHPHTPAAGKIAIFNRSYYEDVLITRVKGWIDDKEAERRMAHIRHFEKLLIDRGTVVLKCFLHISKDEQKARLQARVDDPAKHWKFNPADLQERKRWADYQAAYAAALAATSTDDAPWFVVPANSKTHRNVMIAELCLAALKSMKLKPPKANPAFAKLKIE
ncbi:MAG: UDP-galactose-lipid carrier transferase [Rhodocyclales bacterium]|nr:UDP-galactose-lipid carrier transferase [Rhodocyclales bacterium]